MSEMETWFLLAIIVFIASMLQTSTGFGFSIMSMPFLLFIYEPHTAVQINLILSLLISIIMVFKVKQEVDKAMLAGLLKGSIFGIPVGIIIYLYVNVEYIKVIVSSVIIFLTICLLLKVKIQQTKMRDFFTGMLSGLLTTSIGMPGPPLLLYFSGAGKEKATIRNTTLTYYLYIYFVSLLIQIGISGTNKSVIYLSIASLLPLALGMLLGQWIFLWMNQKTFQIVNYILLLCTGCYLLASSF